MSAKPSIKSGCKQPQCLVDQKPRFEGSVYSRKLGIRRPTKRKPKLRWI
jgi:hypothetical protein